MKKKMMTMIFTTLKSLNLAIFLLILSGCTPKIQLETPAEGITINMNVVVDHRIDVRMDAQSRAVITTTDQADSNKETSSAK